MPRGRLHGTSSFGLLAAAWGLGFTVALPAGAQEPLPVGGEFQVNTYTTWYQLHPSVAAAPDGGFVVVWGSSGSSETDTSFGSAKGQRYSVPATPLSVPSMSPATRFALVAALLLLGAGYALRRRS